MSVTDSQPEPLTCRAGDTAASPDTRPGNIPVEIITAREVPLGGPRAMSVRRTLPQKKRSLIGAWCFVDHYGPDDVSVTGGMDVAPHPHTGLQTVSWLFQGEIEHIDSGGNRGIVRPGEVNLMTSGTGICHSEVSTAATTDLHGVQLWLALPESARHSAPRAFAHHRPNPVSVDGGWLLVFIGQLAGAHSPIATYTPLVGAEIHIDPGAQVTLEIDPAFEHGVLVDAGAITLESTSLPAGAIGYTGIGATRLHLHNASDTPGRVLLIGGEPFAEEIIMWWNFVGRSTEEIEYYREQWQARTDLFGAVEGYVGAGGANSNAEGMSWLPAPTLPPLAFRPRNNPAPHARPDEPEPGTGSASQVFTGDNSS